MTLRAAMKKAYSTIITGMAALMFLGGASLGAQNLRSGYFMDGYTYSFRMNPALTPTRGFVSFPVLGNVNLGATTSLGVSDILYPKADGSSLTTFLNSEVDAATALSRFGERNTAAVSTDIPVMAFGFWGKKGKLFHSVDLSVRADVNASLPYDLFRFAKEGSVNGNVYDLSNTTVGANSYLSLAYGISIPIGKYVRLGLRAKFLYGVANADLSLKGTTLTASGELWTATTDGYLNGSIPAMGTPVTDLEGNIDFAKFGDNFSAENINATSMGNYGAAFDIGLSVDFLRYFTFSASATDLGAISWGNYFTSEGAKHPDGTAKTYIIMDNSSASSSDASDIGERLLKCLKFQSKGSARKVTHLSPMVYGGLEFRMPFYERLSLGALSTTKLSSEKVYFWTEGRFCVNVEPTNWLSINANYAYSTYGHSAGFALSFHPRGFNFFLGTDSYLPFTKITPQGVPVNAVNSSVVIGINFMIGEYRGRFTAK